MIRYALKCGNEHQFESWFNSAAAFDQLKGAGMVECPFCQETTIEKVMMAPNVTPRSRKNKSEDSPQQSMTTPGDPKLSEALAKLREHVETNSEYVGNKFADEATSMHLGDTPLRSIYGEVKPEDAKKMAEDGVPAVPLPFIPTQKTN